MKILREKIFGAIKRANKAARRKHDIEEGFKENGGVDLSPYLSETRKTPEDVALNSTRLKRRLENIYRDKSDNLADKQFLLENDKEGFMRSRRADAKFAAERKRLKDLESKYETSRKRKETAEELRKNNKLGIAVRDAKRNVKKWVKENPGKTAAIGGTVLAAGAGLGYAAYKHNKNKEKEEK